MSEYLLPTNSKLSIEEKQRLFGVKTRMINIPSNYPKPDMIYLCHCGLREDMKHIYICKVNNEGKQPETDMKKSTQEISLNKSMCLENLKSTLKEEEQL